MTVDEVLEHGLRLRDVDPVEQRGVARRRLPTTMRRLVMTQQQERTIRIATIDPVDAVIGDEVRDVTAALHHLARRRANMTGS